MSQHKSNQISVHGVFLNIALLIVELFLIRKETVLTNRRIFFIKFLTYVVMWCGFYLFSLGYQFFIVRHVVYDDNFIAISMTTILFFVLGFRHFERLKPHNIKGLLKDSE